MDLTIHQNCPSCGASIELHEADRLLRCPYCEVKNFMVSRGMLRFALPHKAPSHIDRRDMFYAPYLRFKGNVFYCRGKDLKYKVIDTTQQGLNAQVLPPSLGLRPQAMPVVLATDALQGTFLRHTVMAKTLLKRAAMLTDITPSRGSIPLYHRAFIGERISCIYLPLYVDKGNLYDAVTNTVLASGGSPEQLRQKGENFRSIWAPHFLATLCPRCGDTLTGERDSLILSCKNCHSSWEERQGTFRSIDWSCVVSEDKGRSFLPFWRLQVRSVDGGLETLADFLALTNQPVVITKRHRAMDLVLWVPAFTIRPSTFLRLGKSVTLSQTRIPRGEVGMVKNMHPVTLPREEAVQALKSLVAECALNKRNLLPTFPKMNLQAVSTRLCYLPFAQLGHDLVQEQTGISLARSVLDFGRKL